MPMSRLLVAITGDVAATHQHGARVDVLQPGQDPQRGCLSAARRAQQDHQLTGSDVQAHSVQSMHAAERPVQVQQGDRDAARSWCRCRRRMLFAVSGLDIRVGHSIPHFGSTVPATDE